MTAGPGSPVAADLLPFLQFVAAGASLAAGRPADGLAALKVAVGILGAGSGATMLPELHLLEGDLLAASAADEESRRSAAEPCAGSPSTGPAS